MILFYQEELKIDEKNQDIISDICKVLKICPLLE